MNNQFLRAEIEKEVRRRVALGETFTALDISRAVQASGFRERHRNMKHVVHGMWIRGEMGASYERTLLTFAGRAQAYLYHDGKDHPRAYGNRWQTVPQTYGRSYGNFRVCSRS